MHHNDTEKIAKAIANVLEAKDLIGFGSSIYRFKHHKSLLNIADKISPQKNKKAFIFSTSGTGEKVIDKYHKR